jgi:hypothetical protein
MLRISRESARQSQRPRPLVTSPGRALRSAIRRAGFDLTRRHYYSPIPDLDALPGETWNTERALPGVDLDARAGLDFVRRELTDRLQEYNPPQQPTGDPRDFFLDNGFYESGDAELLYAMVRRFEPTKVLELGSGMSSLVIGDALVANGGETRHIIQDPYPRDDLRPALDQIGELRASSAASISLAEFEALAAGDLLFVDTTHVVKIGSEVNWIVLDVLPALNPGVIVHVHDIYLPWEYPRELMAEHNFFWNEQYLLQAFLAFNPRFEVLFGTHAISRRYPEELSALLNSRKLGSHPSSFWLRPTG